MKNIWKYKILILTAIVMVTIYLLSGYLNENNSTSYQSILAGISSCGTFISNGFSNTRKNQLDYGIVLISMVIVLITLVKSAKYLIKPGEKNKLHIKNQILNSDKSYDY